MWSCKSTCKKTSEGFGEAVCSAGEGAKCACEVLNLKGLEESGGGVEKKEHRKWKCFEGRTRMVFDVLSLR